MTESRTSIVDWRIALRWQQLVLLDTTKVTNCAIAHNRTACDSQRLCRQVNQSQDRGISAKY